MSSQQYPDVFRDTLKLLAILTPLDSRLQGATPEDVNQKAQVWAATILDAQITFDWLNAAVKKVYAQAERPLNPLGAIIAEAKRLRSQSSRFSAAALPPPRRASEPVAGAYSAHGAIDRRCFECGAQAGEPCTARNSDGSLRPRVAPHVSRLQNHAPHAA
ncbi:hypothetical protein CAQU_09985 [Corynebacterium aquilae DSM 44791]|uniref:Uncharacterized protein n=1 Tax=Corynebacterium aquilae DSM 44791 TaxID=1431546 RepID=A0A1L7CHP8_9CORY|nr:hypothetical protein CAQU_09985 [Corynebacterium aquilae DSM 44791]